MPMVTFMQKYIRLILARLAKLFKVKCPVSDTKSAFSFYPKYINVNQAIFYVGCCS